MTEFAETDRIIGFEIDDADAPPPPPDLEQERRVAVFDLIEEGRCRCLDEAGAAALGPCRLRVFQDGDGWRIEPTMADGATLAPTPIDLEALAPMLTDYLAVCDSYRDAVRRLAPSQIEAIDQERRTLHLEGSELLRNALAQRLLIDESTARRLFTVLCALYSAVPGGF